jgi:predicted kinase/uncharacterized HAD superfamily protein
MLTTFSLRWKRQECYRQIGIIAVAKSVVGRIILGVEKMSKMKKIILPVGPPGSGKSTLAKQCVEEGYTRISQDVDGRKHLDLFQAAVVRGDDIFVDRLNFTKQQRSRYLDVAKAAGYSTKVIILYQPFSVCLERCLNRKDHETIKNEESARSALNMFFTKYEPVENTEADIIEKIYPDNSRFPSAIVCDLDGTLCEVEHRRHFVRPPSNTLVGPDGSMIKVLDQFESVDLQEPLPKFKPNWKGFFDAMSEDGLNKPVAEILHTMGGTHSIVLCSGRPDSYKRDTVAWLKKHEVHYDDLFMRNRADHRQDNVVKEIILDFEILTRYKPYFMIDDRDQVVEMWRERGYKCHQVAKGDF